MGTQTVKERVARIAAFQQAMDAKEAAPAIRPDPHAPCRIARNIAINYHRRQGFGKAEALCGMLADADSPEDSLTVEVGFIEARTGSNLVAVAVVRKFKAAKPALLLESGFREVLVYNDASRRWARHTLERDEEASCSHTLGIDLAEYVGLP
jgi:hypothetical protein